MKIKCIDCGRVGDPREFEEFWGEPEARPDLLCPDMLCGGDGVILEVA